MESPLAYKRISILSVSEIRKLLEGVAPDDALIAKLKRDKRAGVRKLANALLSQKKSHDKIESHHEEMLKFERELHAEGKTLIAGVDEAGRGPLAGPVVVGCVIFPEQFHLPGLDDSKKMTGPDRDNMYCRIIDTALAWSVAVMDHICIDEFGIHAASLLGMTKAVNELPVTPEIVLVDGRALPELPCPGKCIIDGDALSLTIAAASVIAKVTRDRIMMELDSLYPGYGLAEHKGYSCKKHINAIKKLGASDIHRMSFEVVTAVTPPETTVKILEKRLKESTTPDVLESVMNGITRNARFISENDLSFLQGIYSECKSSTGSF